MSAEDTAVASFGLKITRAQRDYFNYRFDEASCQAEVAKLRSPLVRPLRDFRSRRERLAEDAPANPVR